MKEIYLHSKICKIDITKIDIKSFRIIENMNAWDKGEYWMEIVAAGFEQRLRKY